MRPERLDPATPETRAERRRRVRDAAVARSQGIPEPIADQPSRAIEVGVPKAMRPYARSLLRWRTDCDVTVLRDGAETYPAMLQALAAAQESICLETYILAADLTGDRFKAVLIERARAGVAVRIIYDAVGSFGLPDTWVDDLRAAGCEVVAFNPVTPWRRRFRVWHRDHRKIIVVDNQVAFTGGLNISNDYASVEEGGVGWHDMHCRVTGPVVYDLARMFRRSWLRGGGARYAPVKPATTEPPVALASAGKTPKGVAYVRVIENMLRRQRANTRRAYLHVLKAAKQYVYIENAYFLPDRGLRRAMIRAQHRGVDVRVVVPGNSDIRMIEWATYYALRPLVKAGVTALRWGGTMLHAKTCVVDGVWSTIGSYNFDAQSRFNNLEVNLEFLDPGVGTALVKHFELTQANSKPYTLESWKRLSWFTKAMSWIAYRLRRWL